MNETGKNLKKTQVFARLFSWFLIFFLSLHSLNNLYLSEKWNV